MTRLWVAVLIALVALPRPGRACTMTYRTVTVGPSFRVKVEDRGRSVNGLAIGLYIGSVERVRAFTDRQGVALFRNVGPGSYFLRAEIDAGIADGVQIQVKLTDSSAATVPLRWPSIAPLVAGSLKGILHGPILIPDQPQPIMSIELLEGISGRRLKTANTDENDAFDFSDATRGLYFLHVRVSKSAISGMIAVEIEPGIATDPLQLDLGWTSCGLFYTDQRQCRQPVLHLERLAGNVRDTGGAAISGAEILLLARGDRLLQRTRTDFSGNFTLTQPADGTYQLAVEHTGFSTLRTALTAGRDGARSLNVQLGVMGGCSSAKTQ